MRTNNLLFLAIFAALLPATILALPTWLGGAPTTEENEENWKEGELKAEKKAERNKKSTVDKIKSDNKKAKKSKERRDKKYADNKEKIKEEKREKAHKKELKKEKKERREKEADRKAHEQSGKVDVSSLF